MAPPSPRLLYMHATREISRRTMLKATGAAAVGLAGLARTAAKLKAGAAPCIARYAKLTANPDSRSGYTARPQVIVYRGVELRPRSTWPLNCGMTRQPVRICGHRARHEQRPYPLIHPMCQRRSAFHISDDV